MTDSDSNGAESPSRLIDGRIAALGDWRGETLAHVRALIHQALPDVVEEWKWRGVPVWSDAGIICTGETYKSVVKLTFAKGASLEDPKGLFNSSLEGDLTDTNKARTVVACNVTDGCWTSAHDSFTTYNRLKETLNGHVRVRAGVAEGDNLLYIAGGYSVAKTTLDLIGDCYDPANPSVPTVYTYSRAKTVSGYTVGAGVEHAMGAHLLVRAEYLYDGYGHQTYAGDGAEWNDRRISLHDSNLRVGVSYKF